MDAGILLVLLGLPVLLWVLLSLWVYIDAPDQGMRARKWGTITLLVPLFGFFTYLLERAERNDSPPEDQFADGPFEIHESRADDTPLAESTDKLDAEQVEQKYGDGDG